MEPQTLDQMLEAAALDAPPGVTVEFENAANGNRIALAIITTCTVVSTLAVCLRMYERLFIKKKFQPEEGERRGISDRQNQY